MAKPKAKVWYVLVLVLGTLALAEAALRIMFGLQGYTVGQLTPNWFPQISSDARPRIDNSFFADSTGVFRANQLYWAGHNIPVNADGFMGANWHEVDTTKQRLLLIGDSFVWGAGADPLSQGFASQLANDSGLAIFNLGIPGADPAQYEHLAARYIPQLQPQAIFVFVYLGNDLVDHQRQLQPYSPIYFATNMGWFPGYYEGCYFENLDSSYQFYKRKYTPSNGFQKIACQTALGTALYSLPLRLQERKHRQMLLNATYTNQHLKTIASMALAHNSDLFIVPIPYVGTDFTKLYANNARKYFITRYQNVFDGLENRLLVLPLQAEHFHPLPNGHFNNKGHQLTSSFLLKTLK